MLLPQELKNKEFTRAMKGYAPAEVDEFIDFLIEKYSEVYTQCDMYDKKLRLVRDRISQIQSEEEAIKKLAVSTQKLCDNMTAEAEAEARKKIDGANAEAEAIIADAKERAETVLTAVGEKSEEKIRFIEQKSEELLLSVRTRCAGILNDFKKDIAAQKASITTLKSIAEDYQRNLVESYKRHIGEIESSVPDLKVDLDSFNESKLLAEIMNDIKNDAIKMANNEKWSSDFNIDGELEKLKPGNYADINVKKDTADNKNIPDENGDVEIGSTKTIPVQKPDKASSAVKDGDTEEFNMVKYKNEIENPAPPKRIDDNADMTGGNETDDADSGDGQYDDPGEAEEDDSYEEDDIAETEAENKRSGKKKGFLGLFKRDKAEKKNKYNDDDFDENEDFDDDDDDFDDDDDDDDDYYGLKNNDGRRTESSIFDD